MSRAGELPVDFHYGPWGNWPSEILIASVGRHMHRFRSFSWTYEARSLNLTLPAPMLQSCTCAETFYALPSDFLGGSAGRLRTLHIGDTRFPHTCPALATVKHLRASCPWHANGDLRFHAIFALCPRLEVLHLRHIHIRADGALPVGPIPRTLRVVKLHARADCDLVQLYNASVLVSVPHVRLKQPLTTSYNMSPFLNGALSMSVSFEPRKKATIVAEMPHSREHRLVLYELEQVFKPALFVSKILRDMKTATVGSLRIPLDLLALLVAAELPWPCVAQLTVDVLEHDANETQPFQFGDGSRRFRWEPLDCLRSLSQSFPALNSLVLSLPSNDTTTATSMIDGGELAQYLREYLSEINNFGLSGVRIVGSR
ncbi:hypothetical protein AURDEDRAFT_171199 [Auricularia subglabra TFB-10046 SS5]|uniref:F-box domain-containing protein n=1 Tax=Auricularia subglabra (strain TFB-10046 / SS5) TaxID=717982 RepID=J0WW86_AURST|nr:hypothetical protein AURDEDRAFT_171199 [Auricularia subglabra TFB-10046 SS5]